MFLSLTTDFFFIGMAIATTGILGFVVFLNNPRSSTGKAFLFFTLITLAYDTVNFLNHHVYVSEISLVLLRLTIAIAVWHVFSLFHLLYVFPSDTVRYPRWYFLALVPAIAATSFLNLTPFVFQGIGEVSRDGQIIHTVNGPGIAVFAMVTLGLIFAALFILWKKSNQAKGVVKRQFNAILAGAIFTFSLLILFHFIMPSLLKSPRFLPFEALFFFPFILGTFYAILRHHLLNARVLSTEILVFLLAAVMFFEVLLSPDMITLVMRSIISVLVLIFGILLVQNVIREMKQREKLQILTHELADANRKLKKLDAAKNEFVGTVSHQLRAPLTVIRGYVSLILGGSYGALENRTREALDRVSSSVNQLAKLVTDLLDLTRMETGTIYYEMKRTDITALARTVADEYKPRAEAKGLTLIFSNESTNAIAHVNSDKMREVIAHLVDNAINYSDRGTISVTVTTQGENVYVKVQDQGLGIKPEDIGKLFVKFSRTEEARKINLNRIGIGLYFAKRIVEDQRGTIRAESAGIGKGSVFTIELPLTK